MRMHVAIFSDNNLMQFNGISTVLKVVRSVFVADSRSERWSGFAHESSAAEHHPHWPVDLDRPRLTSSAAPSRHPRLHSSTDQPLRPWAVRPRPPK